jgi:alpha-galactosidase
MSGFEVLEVRFHFNGEFVLDAFKMLYCNRDSGVSHIEKDKISIPELKGHLLDHTTFPRSIRMYWLPYGADLNSGMKLLVDDKSCLDMINDLGTGRAVDIYTEPINVVIGGNEETETHYADEDVFALF